MKPHIIPIALAIVLALTSCDKGDKRDEGDNSASEKELSTVSRHEELANSIMDSLKEFAAAVSAVSDLESANKAATKISDVGDRFLKIADELKPLDPPAKELKERINQKMEARDAEMEKVMGEELQKTMQSLGPEAQQVLQKAFGEYFGKMDLAGKEFNRHFSVDEETGS